MVWIFSPKCVEHDSWTWVFCLWMSLLLKNLWHIWMTNWKNKAGIGYQYEFIWSKCVFQVVYGIRLSVAQFITCQKYEKIHHAHTHIYIYHIIWRSVICMHPPAHSFYFRSRNYIAFWTFRMHRILVSTSTNICVIVTDPYRHMIPLTGLSFLCLCINRCTCC